MVSSPYMLTGWGERSSFGWGSLGPPVGRGNRATRGGKGNEGSGAVEGRVELIGQGLLAWETVQSSLPLTLLRAGSWI